MLAHPCSDTGRLQSDVSDLQRKVDQCAQSYEVFQLRSDLSRLEDEVGGLSSAITELGYEIRTLQEEQARIREEVQDEDKM